jgi:hypothetical protein
VGRLGEARFAILGVDAFAPSAAVMRNRLERHLAVHNQTRSPWGPVDLRTRVGSWTPQDHRSFSEFADNVETSLRITAQEMMTERVPQTQL